LIGRDVKNNILLCKIWEMWFAIPEKLLLFPKLPFPSDKRPYMNYQLNKLLVRSKRLLNLSLCIHNTSWMHFYLLTLKTRLTKEVDAGGIDLMHNPRVVTPRSVV